MSSQFWFSNGPAPDHSKSEQNGGHFVQNHSNSERVRNSIPTFLIISNLTDEKRELQVTVKVNDKILNQLSKTHFSIKTFHIYFKPELVIFMSSKKKK